MKTRLLLLLLVLTLNLPVSAIEPDTANKVPPVAYVQAMIWKRLNLADFKLTGIVRSSKDGKEYPIILRTRGHELVYEFQNPSLQIRVQINPGNSTLETRTSSSGSWKTLSDTAKLQPILNTDIVYQDLCLDFIDWDNITPLGTDSIKTLPAYAFSAKPGPSNPSRYPEIQYWVSSQFWAFLRIDGLNAAGQLVKRVEVQNVMQIGKFFVFKQMRIGTMVAGKNDIASSTTFIDIQDGAEGSGLKD